MSDNRTGHDFDEERVGAEMASEYSSSGSQAKASSSEYMKEERKRRLRYIKRHISPTVYIVIGVAAIMVLATLYILLFDKDEDTYTKVGLSKQYTTQYVDTTVNRKPVRDDYKLAMLSPNVFEVTAAAGEPYEFRWDSEAISVLLVVNDQEKNELRMRCNLLDADSFVLPVSCMKGVRTLSWSATFTFADGGQMARNGIIHLTTE